MTKSTRSKASSPAKAKPVHAYRVLVVDGGGDVPEQIQRCGVSEPVRVVRAGTLADARRRLAEGRIDLAVIDRDLPDGSGFELADEVAQSKRVIQTILMTHQPDLESAMRALRAGAGDFLVKPLDLAELNERVRQALERQSRDKAQADRVRRLRRLCKKLNHARVEVSRQVDILCNDLVTAYQELACQMQQVVQSSEYAAVIKDELDLEQLLRRTLEHLVEKAGPTNAALFLPANADEFSLGGYVNYDCSAEAADLLLQHLADVLAPRVADEDDLVQVVDNESMAQLIGDDSAYLTDHHLVAFGCRSKGEALAVLVLFRDGREPFGAEALEACAAVGPMLGQALSRIIRIHHRHLPDELFGEPDDDADTLPF